MRGPALTKIDHLPICDVGGFPSGILPMYTAVEFLAVVDRAAGAS